MEEKQKLLILYATQTGNAMDAAERIGREAERRACPVSLLSIDQFDPVCMLLSLSPPPFFFFWRFSQKLFFWGVCGFGMEFESNSILGLFESQDLHMSFFCVWVLLELDQDLTFFVKFEKLILPPNLPMLQVAGNSRYE